ncbi:dephospho-CoA kinase [Asaia sp. W19]|uniref:dephospho-CoA kinase n=1 Tax=unclassified Asaia TaxID=2685023 RepID=UPI000F8CE850|nr:dephospho-CoA kinase [Asaia sp. W19]RUT26592.1 dephospho-CoA kinase [Asaia sp. W19]
MRVLGLTGGMGAGKTTVARFLRRAGWSVFDADAAVHVLQARGGEAVPAIARRWPDCVRNGAVDRSALRQAVIGQPAEIVTLEAIIHPLVRRARRVFLGQMRRRSVAICVLDIPLLFETGADRDCDAVIVVTAPLDIRLRRIMKRRSLTEPQARALLARQMSDSERNRRADILLRNGLSRGHTARQMKRLIARMENPA